MTKVVTVLKIFPEEGVDLAELLERVKKIEGCSDARIEDYVFGAKIIKAAFMCQDEEGKDFEDILSAVQGVSSAQVEEVTLV